MVHSIRIGPGVSQMVRTLTDEQGLVTLDLQPGLHLIVALPKPQSPFGLVTRSVWLTSGLKESVVLECPSRQELKGQVVDRNQIEMAGVQIFDYAPLKLLDGIAIPRGSTAFTNLDGSYSYPVGLGDHLVEFRPSDPQLTAPKLGKITVEDSPLNLVTELGAPFFRVFEILDHTGAPLPDVRVRVSWTSNVDLAHPLYVEDISNELGRAYLPLPTSNGDPNLTENVSDRENPSADDDSLEEDQTQ